MIYVLKIATQANKSWKGWSVQWVQKQPAKKVENNLDNRDDDLKLKAH